MIDRQINARSLDQKINSEYNQEMLCASFAHDREKQMKSSAALIERSEQSVSTSDMSRRYAHYMGRLASGEQDRLVVMKAGKPLAVCLSIQEFEKIQDELARNRAGKN